MSSEADLVAVWFCTLPRLLKGTKPVFAATLGFRVALVPLKWNIYLEPTEKTKLAKRQLGQALRYLTTAIKGDGFYSSNTDL